MVTVTDADAAAWPALLEMMHRVGKYFVLRADFAREADLGHMASFGYLRGHTNLPLRMSTLGFDMEERDGHWFFRKRP